MEQVDLDWQSACRENTTKAYYRFLIRNPESPYSEEAKMRIEETKEQRVFEEGIKDHSMSEYLRDYPQGRMLSEALEYKEKFRKENNRRMIYTSILSIAVLLTLIFTLRDEYHTYNDFSAGLIKFLLFEAIVLVLFDMRRWAFLQFIVAPSIVFFMLVNFSPKIEIISNNQKGDVRRALFYYVKDSNGKNISVSGYNIMNNMDKTLYVTHLEYKKYSKKFIGSERIPAGDICKTTPIDLYFDEPPYRLDMDVLKRKTRRGHTSYVTVHYDKRDYNVLDYQPYND